MWKLLVLNCIDLSELTDPAYNHVISEQCHEFQTSMKEENNSILVHDFRQKHIVDLLHVNHNHYF